MTAPFRLLLALSCTLAPLHVLGQNAGNQKPAPQTRSAAAGATAPATREDPAATSRLFRELDRNHDGYLSDEELFSERGREGNWVAVDRNRDGRISPSEFRALERR
jgi:hypothetical protein